MPENGFTESEKIIIAQRLTLIECSLSAVNHRLSLVEQTMSHIQGGQILEQNAMTHFQAELQKIDIRLKAISMRGSAS